MEQANEQSLRNVFDAVIKVFEESHFLLKDIESKLPEINWFPLGGNAFNSENSNDFNKPKSWIKPFIARYYQMGKSGIKFSSETNRILGIGCFYLDQKERIPIDPLLSVGVFYEPKEKDKYNWFLPTTWFQFCSDRELGKEHIIFCQRDYYKSARISCFKLDSITDLTYVENSLMPVITSMAEKERPNEG